MHRNDGKLPFCTESRCWPADRGEPSRIADYKLVSFRMMPGAAKSALVSLVSWICLPNHLALWPIQPKSKLSFCCFEVKEVVNDCLNIFAYYKVIQVSQHELWLQRLDEILKHKTEVQRSQGVSLWMLSWVFNRNSPNWRSVDAPTVDINNRSSSR